MKKWKQLMGMVIELRRAQKQHRQLQSIPGNGAQLVAMRHQALQRVDALQDRLDAYILRESHAIHLQHQNTAQL